MINTHHSNPRKKEVLHYFHRDFELLQQRLATADPHKCTIVRGYQHYLLSGGHAVLCIPDRLARYYIPFHCHFSFNPHVAWRYCERELHMPSVSYYDSLKDKEDRISKFMNNELSSIKAIGKCAYANRYLYRSDHGLLLGTRFPGEQIPRIKTYLSVAHDRLHTEQRTCLALYDQGLVAEAVQAYDFFDLKYWVIATYRLLLILLWNSRHKKGSTFTGRSLQ